MSLSAELLIFLGRLLILVPVTLTRDVSKAESIPDLYAGVQRPIKSFNIHGRDETVEEDNISVRSDHVEAWIRSRRKDVAIPRTYSSQINPRSNDVAPGVQAVPVQVPAPVVLESVRIPPLPPVLEFRSEEPEPEDVTGASSFSQQILQACEKMVLRSSEHKKPAKKIYVNKMSSSIILFW